MNYNIKLDNFFFKNGYEYCKHKLFQICALVIYYKILHDKVFILFLKNFFYTK